MSECTLAIVLLIMISLYSLGFPETKILKQRVRNVIDPGKNLGHSDTPAHKSESKLAEGSGLADGPSEANAVSSTTADASTCDDCK